MAESTVGWNCQHPGCEKTARNTLYRTNPTGVPGIFMCWPHAEEKRLQR